MINDSYTNPTSLGRLPDGWRVQSIESLCQKVTSGGTPLRSNREFYKNGTIKWVKTGELNDWYIDDSEEKITIEAVKNSSANVLPVNTILMAMYGDGKTITSLGILRNEAATNQACCALIANPNICHYLYLFYALKYHRNDFIQLATGGAQRNLSGVLIRNFALKIPPLKEQEAIAHFLSSLDDKIELNRQMNETLEGIAQALFKSWFVDFDPVKAKAEGQKPEGMDDATAALFPSAFTESMHGPIPEGWTAQTLERVSFLNSESWSRNNTPEQIEYIDLANTKRGIIESTQIFSWKDAPSRAQRILRKGDTVVGTVRPGNGSYSFISLDGLTGSTGFAVLRPKKTFYREFVYLSATSTENIARLAHLADGAAYPAVRPDVVYATPILFPGDEILLRFSQCLSPIMEKVEMNKKENKILGDIRDLLLPCLISGKLRIADDTL